MFDFAPADAINITKETGSIQVGVVSKTMPYLKPQGSRYYNDNQEGAIALSATSVEALLQYVKQEMAQPKRAGHSNQTRDRHDSFNTFTSFDEAMQTYINEPHKVRKFEEKAENVRVPDQAGNDVFFDVTGDFLDMGRYLEGVPEVFGNMYMGNPNNVFADIVLNLCATAYFDEKALCRRGERIVRLVDWLESMRVRTEIRALFSNQCGHVEIMVKRAEDVLDLNAIAVVGHADFFRRILFRVMEYSNTWTSGYGTSMLINNGRMQMPEFEQKGIFIFSENQEEVAPVDRAFDAAEKGIEDMMTNGERHFSIAT